eukprot:COSAG05_NODE_23088_length_260_cov_0.739130_1_plen_33_part_10
MDYAQDVDAVEARLNALLLAIHSIYFFVLAPHP